MIKHVSAAPRCPHAIDHSRRNFDFMHAHLLYARASARRVPLSQRKTMFRCFFWAAPNRTSSETIIPLRRSSSKSWSRSPRLSRSRRPFSGQIVKHGRQFAWHIDHDAVTAADFHDLPSGDAFIFLCEETKGTRIPIIGKDKIRRSIASTRPESRIGISKVASAWGTQRRFTQSRLSGVTLNISAGNGATIPGCFSSAARRMPSKDCLATSGVKAFGKRP